MKTTYFEGVKTYEELRIRYKELARMYHPDRGGDTETMKAINNEYDFLKDRLKDYSADKTEHANDIEYRKIIDEIINLNCRIEIIGTWIWCFEAYEVKDKLKALGFHWANRRKAWIWHAPEDTAKRSKMSIDKIRELHGCEVIREYEKLYIA